MRNCYILLVTFLVSLGSYAQSDANLLVETNITTSTALNLCGDSGELTVTIRNNSSSTATQINFTSDLPDGITILSSQYTNIGTANVPIFDIPDIAAGGETEFSMAITGNCEVLQQFTNGLENQTVFEVTNSNSISYSLNNGSTILLNDNSESYNVRFAELEVKVADDDVNQFTGILEKDADGTVFNREIEVRNSGLGELTEFTFNIDYDNKISLPELSLNGQIITPESTDVSPVNPNFNRYTYIINDFSAIGDGNTVFGQDEVMTFNNKVSLLFGNCDDDPLVTNYQVNWGCNNTFCNEGDQEATSLAYIFFKKGRPNIGATTTVIENGTICGDEVIVEHSYTNYGSDSDLEESDSAFDLWLYDYIIDNFNSNFTISIGGSELTNTNGGPGFRSLLYDDSFFLSDPDGSGEGLEDLDNDGFFDDLPVNNTVTFRVAYNPSFDANNNYLNREYFSRLTLYVKNNDCNPGQYSRYANTSTYFYGASNFSAPEELATNDQFTLVIPGPSGSPFGAAFDFGTSYLGDINLPEGYSIDEVRWTPSSGTPQVLSNSLLTGNTYRIDGGGIQGNYELDISVGCADNAPEFADINWKMYIDACPDSSTLELVTIKDFSRTVFTAYDSCLGGPTCDFVTDSFIMNRNTFGVEEPTLEREGLFYYTKSELNSAAPITKNSPGIRLDAAMPSDNVLIQAEGRIEPNGTTTNYDALIFEFAFDLPGSTSVEIFEHITIGQTGAISIGGTSIPLSINDLQISVDANRRITYKYEVPHTFNNASQKTVVISDLELKIKAQAELIGLNRGFYGLPLFRAKFYGKKAGVSVFSCSKSIGVDFSIANINNDVRISNFVIPESGIAQLAYATRSSIGSGELFPNEFRTRITFDSIFASFPETYSFQLPKLRVENTVYSLDNSIISQSPTEIEISLNDIPIFDIDDNPQYYFYAQLKPICDENYEVLSYYQNFSFTRDIVYNNLLRNEIAVSRRVGNYAQHRLNVPFSIYANSTQEGFEDTVSWPITYEVTSSLGVSKPWIALELKDNDNRTKLEGATYADGTEIQDIVFYGQTADGLPKGMLVKIGAISGNTNRTIYLRATYTDCEDDSSQNINLFSSLAGTAYPLDDYSQVELNNLNSLKEEGVLSCLYTLDEQEITLAYKTGSLSWQVNRLDANGVTDVDLCESKPYEVKVTSSKLANVYDTDVTIKIPAGVSITDITNIGYEYDGQIGTVAPGFIDDNRSTAGEIAIRASELVTDLLVAANFPELSAGDNTIPGSRYPGKNEIVFTMDFEGDCTMDPGVPIRFNLTGLTNCGESKNFAYNRYLPIKGIDRPENLVLEVTPSDFMVCNSQNQVDIDLRNTGDEIIDLTGQQLKLTLPQGVSYGGVANGAPVPTQSGNQLIWDIADVNTNKNQYFSIYTTLTDYSLTEFEYTANVVGDGQATCLTNNQTCNVQVSSAFGFGTAEQITLPQLTIVPISVLPVCDGTPVVVAVEFAGAADYENFTFDWNVTPVAQNGNQFTFELADFTQLSVNVAPNGNNDNSCLSNDTLDVDVYPAATITATLVEGATCATEANGQVTLTINGEQNTGYTEQLPFTITGVSPAGALTIGQQVTNGEVLTVENLPAGLFTVTFQDNYGCTFEESLEIPVMASPIANFCTSLLPCDTVSGDVQMSFDMGNVHSDLNGTTYTASVKDAQSTEILNFTGSFPDTQNRTLAALSAQAGYRLEITAANGCTYTRPFVVDTYGLDVNITPADEMTVGAEACSRNLTVDISHNISPCSALSVQDYEITLGTIDSNNAFEGSPQVLTGVTAQTTFDDLEVGRYKIIVRPSDITGGQGTDVCEAEEIFEVTPDISFTTALETVDPLCAGEATGRAEVIISGGSGDFTAVWTASGSSEVISTGYTALNLSAGDYEVVVTDNNGCPQALPLTFELVDPEALEVPFIEDVQTACEAIAGGNGGTVAVGYDTGVAPYSFVWYEIVTTELDDGSTATSEALVHQETVQEGGTSVYSDIPPGDYKVVVTDASGCTAESPVTTVTQPEVDRQYHIALSWSSKVIEEKESKQPGERNIDPIAATSFKRAISSQVERCIAEAQEVAQENVAMILKDIDRLKDTLNLTYVNGTSDVYHYTLYYYDRAGNLVRTVPPAGVNLATNGDGDIDRVPTGHTHVTGYDYNSIAQLQKQNTPDGGTTDFLYNDIGQLLYSQNGRQIADAAFSYSIYDELGRIVEAGEAKLNGRTFPDAFLVNNQADPSVATALPLADKVEYIRTTFNDRAGIRYRGKRQRYLRNRVSEIYNLDKNGQETRTYYSYDPHGNVEWVVCKLPGVGQTTVAYEYDLISGNVNEVVFNEGKTEEYRHHYSYDEDNRIISVKTSKEGYFWDEDARYDYYLHGPLARTELGEDRVQGLDFTYTVHGWLKGINTPDLAQNAFNPDGANVQGDMAAKHARDEFGMALGYYEGDFARDGIFDTRLTAANPFVLENQIGGDLYNGNIGTWTSQTAEEARSKNLGSYITGNAYRYDQLNRIKQATTKAFNEAGQSYTSINGSANAFESNYSYDGNGNLKTLRRFKDDGQLMDDLTYHYDLTDPNLSNQLTHVDDGVGQVSAEINDLPDQGSGNYQYDAIGQLIRDESEGLTYVWNTSGKVSEIIPDNTNNANTQKVHLKFTYDGMGNRIVKQVNRLPYASNGDGPQINDPEAVETTYYSRDAQGNVMGIYQREEVKVDTDPSDKNYTANFKIVERPMYGNERVGQDTFEEEVFTVTYNFENDTDYEGVVSEFLDEINSVAYSNVMVAQNNDKELQAVDGSSVTVAGTTLVTAMVDGEFVALNYTTGLIQDTNSTPVRTDNNVFLIEDAEENPLGYGMVAANYFNGDADEGVMLIYDTNGQLIPGLQLINADTDAAIDVRAKSVVVGNPGQANEYLLFYRDVNGDLHTARLSATTAGLAVTAIEDHPFSNYGRHMAVVEDEQHQTAYVYATTHTGAVIDGNGTVTTPPQANLVRFTVADNGTIGLDGPVVSNFESYDTEGNGELQIALDGSAIGMYNYTSAPTQWTGSGAAEIRTWPLSDAWLPMEGEVQQRAIGSNVGKGSLLHTGEEIFYTRFTHDIEFNSENTMVKRLSTAESLAEEVGDLRPNKNDKFYYFAAGKDSGEEYNLTASNNVVLTNLPASDNGSTGYQPYQPYTLNGVAPAPTNGLVYRNVGNKYYELKDHLGNVRVVVSDRKNLNTSDNSLSANVVSYANYYPFGMPQPNRNFDSQEYRYGFQGQEKDSELKGEGLSVNYKYRMHDPRVGRFFVVDPLAAKYPYYTPYSFSGNKTIAAVELEGLEEAWLFNSTQTESLVETAKNTEVKTMTKEQAIMLGQAAGNTAKGLLNPKNWWDGAKRLASDFWDYGTGNPDVYARAYSDWDNIFDILENGSEAEQMQMMTDVFAGYLIQKKFPKVGKKLALVSGVTRLEAYKYAATLLKTRSGNKTPRNVTVVYDRKNKKYYYGESGGLSPNDPKITQQLKDMMPEESLTDFDVQNCSECHALNNAFRGGAKKADLEYSTVEITKPRPKNNYQTTLKDNPPCDNCQITTDGIKRKDGN